MLDSLTCNHPAYPRGRCRASFFFTFCFALALSGFVTLKTMAATTLSVGTNVNISKSSGNNVEELIVIDPTNPNNLFASETYLLVSKYSTNGGITWFNSNLSALPASLGDVSAAWDRFGNLFLTRFGPSESIVVAVSTNSGATFTLKYQTTSVNNDQPTITTGPSGFPGPGSVWISYTDSSGVLVVQGALVPGLGLVNTFSAPQVAGVSGGDFGDIAIGPNGQVMVAYQDSNSGIGSDIIRVNLDPDGLGPAGFNGSLNATATQVGAFAPIPAQPKRSIDAEAGLAWDLSGGPHQGRVYLMYTDRPSTSSSDTDIYVRFSDNNGTNWSTRVKVNDGPTGKSQFLPRIALDQTSGDIAVSFYDCRNSAGNNTAEVWATVSQDGGLTFLPNVKVSGGISSALVSAVSSTQFDFGDYTGLAFHGGTLYPCWADNSNSTGDNPNGAGNVFDIYTARVIVNTPLVILNPRFLPPSRFEASIRTTATKTYFLESTESLSPTSWASGPAIPGDGTTKTLVDTNATSSQKFYRVRVQ